MDRFSYNQQSVVKKSPIIIVKNFIVLQMAAIAVLFLSGILLDYGQIYRSFHLPSSLSYRIVEAMGIFGLETGLVFYIFFAWYKEYYDIRSDKISHGKGIIFRKRTVIPLSTISSVSYRQGPLARLTKYGSIELKEGNFQKTIVMEDIPEPQLYVQLIVNLKEELNNGRKDMNSQAIEDLLVQGENERLEFKTSFRWDMTQNRVNKNLEKAAMKTIIAFLNSGGGRLLIGVDDSGNVAGLEADYNSLPKPNADGFQNHWTNIFNQMVGPEFRQFVEMNINKAGDKDICSIRVAQSGKPAYLKLDNGEEFYIRTGNGTTSLKLSEASSYIDYHWKARLL